MEVLTELLTDLLINLLIVIQSYLSTLCIMLLHNQHWTTMKVTSGEFSSLTANFVIAMLMTVDDCIREIVQHQMLFPSHFLSDIIAESAGNAKF